MHDCYVCSRAAEQQCRALALLGPQRLAVAASAACTGDMGSDVRSSVGHAVACRSCRFAASSAVAAAAGSKTLAYNIQWDSGKIETTDAIFFCIYVYPHDADPSSGCCSKYQMWVITHRQWERREASWALPSSSACLLPE